jgi:hypothetical protein
MIRVTGTWKARVEQSFEIEVDDESDIESAIHEEMSPRNVVELMDFEFEVDLVVDNDEEA